MKLELLRLSGQPVHRELWRSAPDIPGVDLDECVKDELMSFYDLNQREFWPKEEYRDFAPEVARTSTAVASFWLSMTSMT